MEKEKEWNGEGWECSVLVSEWVDGNGYRRIHMDCHIKDSGPDSYSYVHRYWE